MATVSRYTAFLKAKRGEAKAIKLLSSSAKSLVTPFFEIPNYVPVKKLADGKVKKFDERFDASCAAIADCWDSDNPILLDLDFGEDRRLERGGTPIDVALGFLREFSIPTIPVATLDRSSNYIRTLVQHTKSDTQLIALRLFLPDIGLPSIAKQRIGAFLAKWNFDPKQVILILDFSSLIGNRDSDVRVQTVGWASDPYWAQFSGMIFSGSSMPKSEDIPKDMSRVSRRELAIWKHGLSNLGVGFGDYGVTHPLFIDSDARGAAKIRYATADEWIIQKGVRLSTDEPLQYQKMCLELISENTYRQNEVCFGNSEIQRCSKSTERLGNLESWVAIDTNVHVHFTAAIVNQILQVARISPTLIQV